MTNAAQVDRQPEQDLRQELEDLQEPFALKQQVAERLAAHRARRSGTRVATEPEPASETPAKASTTTTTSR